MTRQQWRVFFFKSQLISQVEYLLLPSNYFR